MFNLDGLFTLMGAVFGAFMALLFVILKLSGVLLLGWWWMLLLAGFIVLMLFLSVNGIG